jgi:hypothetical protein
MRLANAFSRFVEIALSNSVDGQSEGQDKARL